jgi:hypothetical protein
MTSERSSAERSDADRAGAEREDADREPPKEAPPHEMESRLDHVDPDDLITPDEIERERDSAD